MRRRLLSPLTCSLWLSLALLPAADAWACPMCKMALESDDPQPRAYMYSILFLLAVIGTVFGAMTGLLCWVSRWERRALQSAGYEHLLRNAVTCPAAVPANAAPQP
jgi:hypothetical protein